MEYTCDKCGEQGNDFRDGWLIYLATNDKFDLVEIMLCPKCAKEYEKSNKETKS